MLIAFMLITSLAIACYFIIWIFNEEGHTHGFIYYFLNYLYDVVAVVNKVFDRFGVLQGWSGVFLGVVLSGLFYTGLIEFVCVKYTVQKPGCP